MGSILQLSYGKNKKKDFLRNDVVYKSIIRDLRKFYTEELNKNTSFIYAKRFKHDNYFSSCLQSYISLSFPELERDANSLKIEVDLDDIYFFFGGLTYPKDLHRMVSGERNSGTPEKL